ncbi:ParB N-terminal domain-containing protein [Nocardia sp. NPDC004604]|uniref:ParB N-terminal domain-containing protein n=1 Tax=Nocardia sp. NPDC004604 TaxID=3157013 RepID=UPI0033B2B850
MGSLPPIVVHRATMMVVDGVHRVRAAQCRGLESIDAVFFEGDVRQAFVLAVHLNSRHGLPLSLADRKSAAERILRDFPEWSNRKLGEVAGLSDKTIAAIRRRSGAEIPHPAGGRVGRDGVVYPGVVGQGRRRAEQLLESNPAISARELALAAGVSLTTSKDVRRRAQERAISGAGADSPSVPIGSQRSSSSSSSSSLMPAGVSLEGVGSDDPGRAIRTLHADPSVRFTDQGRKLLRILHLSPGDPGTWMSIVESLPPHCMPLIAELANQHSDTWANFARFISQHAGADIRGHCATA